MLRLTNLSFAFRHRRLFADVSLNVNPGELVHLRGQNGAGKSTLMAVVAGLLSPASGTVEYFPGVGATAPTDDRRRFMEYLPAEANGLYLKMDAVQNLAFWSSLRGHDNNAERLYAALARWNLDHPLLRDRFPVEKFSTGMKRRLALARLDLAAVPCWLLDEPVYGLDAEAMVVFRNQLADHLQGGGMALVISHDLKPLEGLITNSLALGGTRK